MKKSLKMKFITAFSCTIAVVLVMFCISMYTFEVLIGNFEDYSSSLSELNEFRYQFGEFNESVEAYLEDGTSSSLEKCQDLSQSLNVLCNNINVKYMNSNDETQVSLVSAILSNYPTYINQVQSLIDMENTTEAIGLYNNKYSKNGEYISTYIEQLISYRYRVSEQSLDNTNQQVKVFEIINISTFGILTIIIAILFRMIFHNVITPIQKLARQSQQIANYNFDVENIEVTTKDEVASLVNMFNHMREKLKMMFNSNMKNLQMAEELLAQIHGDENIKHLVQHQKNLNEEMFREANIDHLTNLMNKNAFIHCVNENIKSIHPDELCALFVVDIDNFESISSTLGEGADELIKYTAVEMTKLFKDCGFIARWSRDIFVGFISGLPNEEFSHQKCKEINSILDIHFRHKKKYHPVSASVGVCLCTNPVSAENMFERAEKEVNTVKVSGKNGYHISVL